MIEFPISGVETYWWLPTLVAFVISSMTSAGGVTGAFILLPFQMSFLGFTGPSVSATNLLFNVMAVPGGVIRYWREKRMMWPLAWTLVLGTLPGIFIGAIIRVKYLPDPRNFKLFVGVVLLYLGVKVGRDALTKKQDKKAEGGASAQFKIVPRAFSLRRIDFEFNGAEYTAPTWVLLLICVVVGVIGGTYGIGGGAFLSPILVSFFALPIYTVAGATLVSTFVSSIAGVLIYTAVAPHYADTGLSIRPDYLLGFLFGLGGLAGVYTGARLQRYLPARLIKLVLTACLLFIAGRYILGYFAAG